MKALFFFITLCLSTSALSYTVSTFRSQSPIQYSDATHIFVIGYSGGLSDQFFRAAAGRALRYRELNSQSQIIFIGPDRMDSKSRYLDEYDEYRARLKRMGLHLVSMNEKWLTSHRLIPLLEKFTQIKSLEFFAHSAAHKGVGLDDISESSTLMKYKRFNERSPGVAKLRDNFSTDGFILLHGCNSGFMTAPRLAEKLKVPVMGSLAATNFQEIFSDNEWYFNDKGRYPEDLSRATRNTRSFARESGRCRSGLCTRMKPEPYPYSGYWGRLNAGLSHYKFFCGTATPNRSCKKAMAHALLAMTTDFPVSLKSSLSDFRWAAKDFLCPDASRPTARQKCWDALTDAEQGRDSHFTGMVRGTPLKCDFRRCDLDIRCGSEPGSCKIKYAPANPYPRTMVREYLTLIDGFHLIK